MQHSTTHSLLKWIAIFGLIFAFLTLVLDFFEGFPRVKDWAQGQFDQWWPVMTAPWFLIAGAVLIVLCIWPFFWPVLKNPQEPVMPSGTVNISHSGSGHNIVANTLNLGPQQRTLSDTFVERVAPHADTSVAVQVRVYGTDNEMQTFGTSIISALRSAGFNATSFGVDAGTQTFSGVQVEYAPNERSRVVGNAIYNALNKQNLRVSMIPVDAWKEQNFVRVGVGGNVQ